MQPLTEREQQIYDWIIAHIEKYGAQPSYRDIADQCQISVAYVHIVLKAIEEKQYIRLKFDPGGGGYIELIDVRFKAHPVTPCPISPKG